MQSDYGCGPLRRGMRLTVGPRRDLECDGDSHQETHNSDENQHVMRPCHFAIERYVLQPYRDSDQEEKKQIKQLKDDATRKWLY